MFICFLSVFVIFQFSEAYFKTGVGILGLILGLLIFYSRMYHQV